MANRWLILLLTLGLTNKPNYLRTFGSTQKCYIAFHNRSVIWTAPAVIERGVADRCRQWEHGDRGAAAATGRSSYRWRAALRHPRRSLSHRRVAHWSSKHQSWDAWRGLGGSEARRVARGERWLLARRVAGDASGTLQSVRDTAAAAVERSAYRPPARADLLLRALPTWELRGLLASLAAAHPHLPSVVQPCMDLTDQRWPRADRLPSVLGARPPRHARKRVQGIVAHAQCSYYTEWLKKYLLKETSHNVHTVLFVTKSWSFEKWCINVS